MIDLSTSPTPNSAFSFVALCSSSVAISLIPLANDLNVRVNLLGIVVDKAGRIIPRTRLSMMEKDGLMDPIESNAASIGEVLPLREPKSCEKPPIPMLSSLVQDDQGHDKSVERRRGRIARHVIHPIESEVRFND